jgi:RTX calcium-binding nonapeptide repeat (4 copies)
VMRAAAIACTAVALGLSETARAATVELRDPGAGDQIRFTAAPGERNDLTFTEIEDSWPTAFLVRDAGAPLTVGRGCFLVDAHTAACVATSGSMYHMRVRLGDGDDTLHPVGFHQMRADGGPGDDVLLGGIWNDRLNGGGGRDELRGGLENDILLDGDGATTDADVLDGGPGGDWVSYEDRTAPVTVDLAEPGPDAEDTLLGIEHVHGGRGDDRLAGDDGPNVFDDEGGRNELLGRGGADAVYAAASGRVACGGGRDVVRGVTRQARLAPDCEKVVRGGFEADAHPRPSAEGFVLRVLCTISEFSDRCSGSARLREAAGRRRVLAQGPIPAGSLRRTARLTLTATGRRLLARRNVTAVVELRGSRIPDLEWQIELARTRPPTGEER